MITPTELYNKLKNINITGSNIEKNISLEQYYINSEISKDSLRINNVYVFSDDFETINNMIKLPEIYKTLSYRLLTAPKGGVYMEITQDYTLKTTNANEGIVEPPSNNEEYYGNYFIFAKHSETSDFRIREKRSLKNPRITVEKTSDNRSIYWLEVPHIEEV